MSTCNYESWSIIDLSKAIKDQQKDGKTIKVPMFQRGIVWNSNQYRNFIDSLKQGYPIGTLLFYKTVRNDKEIYTLIDGLQRCNTIKRYVEDPNSLFSNEDIEDTILEKIFSIMGYQEGSKNTIISKLREAFIDFIQSNNDISDIQYYDFALSISKEFPIINEGERFSMVMKSITPFVKKYKETYQQMLLMEVPVIVYTGAEKNLPDIFDRINNGGTKLNKYQVYAASWSLENKITISNKEIVNKILSKYDSMIIKGFELQDYNREQLMKTKEFTAFEYVFGFGKYINDKYTYLFEKDNKDNSEEEINPLGFELINACLGKNNDNIRNLYNDLFDIDLTKFEIRLIEIIEYINNLLKPYICFKGNQRNTSLIPHSKYQIISIICTTFIEKYDIQNLEKPKQTWRKIKPILDSNIIKHYVYDVISREWGDGGIGKIFTLVNDNKYLKLISKNAWISLLDNWFEGQMERREITNVALPKLSDKLFLNCIYSKLFSAEDQLSINKFDIEHIVTKEYLKKKIKVNNWNGLPVSCISNLCYLPEQQNRSKKEHNFYQDENYLLKFNIGDIENKFSFINRSQLEWMDITYQKSDYEIIKYYYCEFLKNRFTDLKNKFFEVLEI